MDATMMNLLCNMPPLQQAREQARQAWSSQTDTPKRGLNYRFPCTHGLTHLLVHGNAKRRPAGLPRFGIVSPDISDILKPC